MIKEIREKGEINVKSKNMLITNINAEITIKRYTKLIKLKEKLNLKFSRVIDEIRSKNYHKFDIKKFLTSTSSKFDGN